MKTELTIKTPEWHQGRRCSVFIVNLEQISHLFSSIVYFEQVNIRRVDILLQISKLFIELLDNEISKYVEQYLDALHCVSQ